MSNITPCRYIIFMTVFVSFTFSGTYTWFGWAKVDQFTNVCRISFLILIVVSLYSLANKKITQHHSLVSRWQLPANMCIALTARGLPVQILFDLSSLILSPTMELYKIRPFFVMRWDEQLRCLSQGTILHSCSKTDLQILTWLLVRVNTGYIYFVMPSVSNAWGWSFFPLVINLSSWKPNWTRCKGKHKNIHPDVWQKLKTWQTLWKQTLANWK